jgi:hypothetical protein
MTQSEYEKVSDFFRAVTERMEMARRQIRDRNYGLAEFTLSEELPTLTVEIDEEV